FAPGRRPTSRSSTPSASRVTPTWRWQSPRTRCAAPSSSSSTRWDGFPSMTAEEVPVVERLRDLGIAFERHEHPPVATVEQAAEHWGGIDAAHCKNLFLRNQKGDRHYLLILEHSKKADLRAVANQIGDGKLSFGSPERLRKHLGLTPGSVSPFGLIHDSTHSVR